MAGGPLPTWMVVWLVVSSLIVIFDGCYVLLRPASMPGGELAHVFRPYAKYITVDHMYGHMEDDGTRYFIVAQTWANGFEVVVALYSVFLHASGNPSAIVTTFGVSVATFAKTVLYAFVELASGNRHTGHNGLQDWLLVYIIPNYCWIVFPYIIVLSLGRRLMVAAASSKPKSS